MIDDTAESAAAVGPPTDTVVVVAAVADTLSPAVEEACLRDDVTSLILMTGWLMSDIVEPKEYGDPAAVAWNDPP